MCDECRFKHYTVTDLRNYRNYLNDRINKLSRYIFDCDNYARGKLVAFQTALEMFDNYLYGLYGNDDFVEE